MIDKLNIIYNEDCLEGLKRIPDESIDLVIADPPYFKVVGESWDYKHSTITEYIELLSSNLNATKII